MKILVLSSHTTSLWWFRMDMMRTFLAAGHEVLAVGSEPEDLWKDSFAKQGIQYRQIPVQRTGRNPLEDIKTLRSIRKMIRTYQPDRIFAYQAKTVIYGSIAAWQCGMSEVYLLIGGLGSIFRGAGFRNKCMRMLMSMQYRIACRIASRVMFQNEDDRECFLRRRIVSSGKTEIIHGSGVNVEHFQAVPIQGNPAFLMIARLIRDKGILEYLEACRVIRREYQDVRCMLVGPFDSNPTALSPQELAVYVDEGSVEYIGEQEDVREYLRQCTVFVLPSYHEGTPKTVLEAMATARAVITTDAPGCRETVRHGENGYLVPVRDVTELVQRMRTFIEQPQMARDMGIAGRLMAEDKYDVRKVNRQIASIMNIQIDFE